MSSNQLSTVRALLAEARAYQHTSLDDLRQVVSERNARFKPPSHVHFQALTLPRSGKPPLQIDLGVPAGIECRRTILYLHGGGFMVGDAAGFRGLAGTLAADACARVAIVEYRLAPEHPFPAAIDDAADAYAWLLETGTAAKDIVIAGDSAGGALALSMMQMCRAESRPLPAGSVLFSPWVDLALGGTTVESKRGEDLFLAPEMLHYLAQTYLAGANAEDARASPLLGDLHGLPPVLIQVGSAEILLDDAVRLAAKMGGQGGRVTLDIWPEMPHVWQAFSPILDEARAAIGQAAAFILDHTVEHER